MNTIILLGPRHVEALKAARVLDDFDATRTRKLSKKTYNKFRCSLTSFMLNVSFKTVHAYALKLLISEISKLNGRCASMLRVPFSEICVLLLYLT